MVRSLLSSMSPIDASRLDPSTLPHGTMHVTPVQFVSENTETTTAADIEDDQSEDGAKYTLETPYESTVVGARYLTTTSCDAANEICEMPQGNAQDILDKKFPLQIDNDTSEASRNGKRVIELSLSLPDDQSWEYQPGDSLGLIVANTSESVDFVLNMLQSNHGVSPSQKICIDSVVSTVEELVKEKMDLCTVLKSRKILLALSKICTDPRDKAILELLSSKTTQGNDLMETFVHAQRRSVVDILREFPSCQGVTLENLVSILPPIPPRYYSVSSSPLDGKGKKLTVAFSVVDYLTPSLLDSDGAEVGLRRIHGLATSHIESFCSPFLSSTSGNVASRTLKIFPKPTEDFHLPADPSIPLVLIGPGTGIAPFVGFLAHRQAQCTNGSVDVFFGCRHADHDFLYKDELVAFEKAGVINQLNVAFSRDGAKKEYVQDIMTGNEECSKRLADIVLDQNGRVYVCGDGNHMGRDVQSAFAKLLGSRLASEEEGKTYVEKMKTDGRFLLDIWS
jgi:sulfite reductase alpha subunit-like flavoprotein